MDVVAKELGHCLCRIGQGADMDRHVLGLGDQPAAHVADRGREVAARIEDLRIRRAQHRLAHLLDDRQQSMLYDRGDDRIDGGYRGFLQSLTPARRRETASLISAPCSAPETIAAAAGHGAPPQSSARPGRRYPANLSSAAL